MVEEADSLSPRADWEHLVSTGELFLIALAILVPLAVAIAVTLWTLQPAVKRAERAKRARKRISPPSPPSASSADHAE